MNPFSSLDKKATCHTGTNTIENIPGYLAPTKPKGFLPRKMVLGATLTAALLGYAVSENYSSIAATAEAVKNGFSRSSIVETMEVKGFSQDPSEKNAYWAWRKRMWENGVKQNKDKIPNAADFDLNQPYTGTREQNIFLNSIVKDMDKDAIIRFASGIYIQGKAGAPGVTVIVTESYANATQVVQPSLREDLQSGEDAGLDGAMRGKKPAAKAGGLEGIVYPSANATAVGGNATQCTDLPGAYQPQCKTRAGQLPETIFDRWVGAVKTYLASLGKQDIADYTGGEQ